MDLYGNACSHLYTTWNIAVRRLYELPWTVHTRLLCNITNLPHIKHDLKCRFIKFVNNATKSCNKKVKFLAEMCISNTLSVTGCKISNILCEYKISIFDIMYGNNVCALMNKSNTKSNNIGNEKWKYNIILEMLDCLYSLSDCGLSMDEARQCLIYAATIWIFM